MNEWSPFLKIGEINDVFQSVRKTSLLREILNILVKMGVRINLQSYRAITDIPSGPILESKLRVETIFKSQSSAKEIEFKFNVEFKSSLSIF